MGYPFADMTETFNLQDGNYFMRKLVKLYASESSILMVLQPVRFCGLFILNFE
jgi:hypothetical protein